MHRSPLALAALATVAVPGMDPYDVRALGEPDGELDTALVVDAGRNRWVVRAPTDASAGAALEAEVAVVGRLDEHRATGLLPFAVPKPVGFAALPEGGRAVVHAQIVGRPLDLAGLAPGPGLAADLGRAIAALHELPVATVEDLGLPTYSADEYRRRRQSEVDEAARTGRVPAPLLARWEARLEDVGWWRFRPTVVHGDLSEDRVLVHGQQVAGVLDWSRAMVADPADDLAWLLIAAPADAAESVLEAYQLRRTELIDPHLTDRALLAGELAIARWLLFGVHSEDDDVVADATAMLAELDEQTQDEDRRQAAAAAAEAAWAADAQRAAAAEHAATAERVETGEETEQAGLGADAEPGHEAEWSGPAQETDRAGVRAVGPRAGSGPRIARSDDPTERIPISDS
jgi:aminoglycoside phosphotransferase (APT) family kinase protein